MDTFAPAISVKDPPTDTTHSKAGARDLIISGGFNIYPREIEEFLLEQEEVTEGCGRRRA